MKKHAFVKVAEAQRQQKTLLCVGLDVHSFGKSGQSIAENYKANMDVYGKIFVEIEDTEEFAYYDRLVAYSLIDKFYMSSYAALLAAIELYIKFIIDTAWDAGIRIFKLQFGLYIQFTVEGVRLLQRIKQHLDSLGAISILDCKPGDIFTTQTGYMTGYMDNLSRLWGVDYKPFGFDIINPSPWMGDDVLVLEDNKGNPLLGLELLREGKGLVYVNKTSNPSGPQYQGLQVYEQSAAIDRVKQFGIKPTLQLVNAADAYILSQKFGLEQDGLSQLGLVIGATHKCDGSIRKIFPAYTGVNPGFGAQSRDDKDPLTPFKKLMPELIRTGKWNGQGSIFCSSRALMFPWMKKYGGSGNIYDIKTNLLSSIQRHRELEEEAYQLPEVVDAGIIYPFK